MISVEQSTHVTCQATRASRRRGMKQALKKLLNAGALSFLLAAPALAGCPDDSVQVGPICVDKYEASVWSIPANKTTLIGKIKHGAVTLANLTSTAGVVQRGAVSDNYGAGCQDTGNGCMDFYAVSVPGVLPSVYITWFQAAAACRNAGKRLLTKQESGRRRRWGHRMATPVSSPPGILGLLVRRAATQMWACLTW